MNPLRSQARSTSYVGFSKAASITLRHILYGGLGLKSKYSVLTHPLYDNDDEPKLLPARNITVFAAPRHTESACRLPAAEIEREDVFTVNKYG